MTDSSAGQKHKTAARYGVEDWHIYIYIYIYIYDEIHQTLKFSASVEIFIGF